MKSATEPFKLYNTYYDLLYKDKDYLKEAAYVHKLIQQYAPAANTILELGSGTGNYSKQFSKAGYSVTGIELNEEMNQIASSKSIANFNGITGDIALFRIPQQFDAAVALFHVVSYLNDNDTVISCFKNVSSHLKSKGVFIFDVWYTPAVYTQVPQQRIKDVENETISIIRKARPVIYYNKNTVEVNYEMLITDKKNNATNTIGESHTMRHFSTPEVELLANISGLTLVHAEEFLTSKDPGKDTWGVCYILQK